MLRPLSILLAAALAAFSSSCASTVQTQPLVPPIPGAEPVDHLIQPGEQHFAKLWKLTTGGENAEAYFNRAGNRLVLQRRDPVAGVDCDRIYVTTDRGDLAQVSTGAGVTTCAYFMPGDGAPRVVFASTHGGMESCPPPADHSQGYVWTLYPEYDLYTVDLDPTGNGPAGAPRALVSEPGYDAEATLAPDGKRLVFTSTRSGDIELWTMNTDGTDLVQVTDEPGYDGGAFYSHDGKRLVFRSTAFTPGQEEAELADYRRLLADWKVRPSHMELMVVDVDGSNRHQITQLGGANFAPYFFPDDKRVIFASNHHDPGSRNFDLFAVDLDGGDLEQITHYDEGRGKSFDSFPMFSPDGRWLVFSSNRGEGEAGETNVFLALWQ